MNPVFVISLSSTFLSLTFSHYLTFFSRVDVGLLFPTCQRRGNLFSIYFWIKCTLAPLTETNGWLDDIYVVTTINYQF